MRLTSRSLICSLALLAAAFSGPQAQAQCDNPTAYDFRTLGAPGTSVTVFCHWSGEYSEYAGATAAWAYSTVSDIPTDFFTVRQGTSSGPVIAFGTSPLYWQATVGGTYFIHINYDNTCGGDATCRNVTTTTIGPVCDNTVLCFYCPYGDQPAPTPGNTGTVPCQYASEYSRWTGVVAGQEYVIASDAFHPTDYVTVRLGASNGPAIAAGTVPLTVVAPSSGDWYTHFSLDNTCATEDACRDITMYATPPPGCINANANGIQSAPTPGSSASVICNNSGDYSTWNGVVANLEYQIASTIPTDYLSVNQGAPNGPLVTSGVGPLSITPGVGGAYYVHVNYDNTCGSDAVCRDITWTAGCFSSGTFFWTNPCPSLGGTTTISCAYAFGGYSSEWTAAVAGRSYTLNTDFATDYLTIRSGTAIGPIVGGGLVPVLFTAPAAGSYYVTIAADVNCGEDFSFCHALSWTHNVSCTQPAATASVLNELCPGGGVQGTFEVEVDLTSLGDAPTVDIEASVDGGPSTVIFDDVNSLQVYNLGTYTVGQDVDVTIVHNGDADCTLPLPRVTDSGNCATQVVCGDPVVNETFCYPNSMNTFWKYQSSGGGTLRFTANSLGIESSTWDHITIYDGVDNTGTELFNHTGTTTNYGGMVLIAPSGNLYISATSDTYASCQDGNLGYGQWDWDVECLNCTPPVASVNSVADCGAGTYAVEVTVTGLGDATDVDISSDVTGVIATNVGVGTYTSSGVAYGTPQVITVAHSSLSVCDITFNVNPTNLCVTNATCGYSVAVPDAGCFSNNNTEAIISISGVNTVLGTDVALKNVDLIMTHTYNADMVFELESPNGAIVALITNEFGFEDNFGNPANCPNEVLTLQDGGLNMAAAGAVANVTGIYAPEQSLSGFNDGSNPNGNWILRMCDGAGADLGFLNYVDLNFVNCAPAQASQAVVPNCVDNEMSIDVTITSMGSSTSIDIVNNVDANVVTALAPGTYTVGPFSFPVSVQVSLLADNPDCDSNLPALTYGACPPVNDNCGDTPPVVLGHGDSFATTGTLEGSTVDFPYWGTPDIIGEVWYPFTLTEPCNLVLVKTCGTVPSPFYTTVVATTDCPADFGEWIFGQASFDYCFDGSPTVVYSNMPAGTYYYPVLLAVQDVGLTTFSIEIDVEECPNNVDCLSANPIVCGDVKLATTAGAPNNIPELGEACLYCSISSSGGTNWWSYNQPTTDEVTVSTCDIAFFDTRISVYQVVNGLGCDSLRCISSNDDGPGCSNFSSETHFTAVANEQYYVVVHGWGSSEGVYNLAVTCAPACVVPANDECPLASSLTPVLMDGTGVPATGTNACAHSDVGPFCDTYGGMQGVWYTFNTADRSEQLRLSLLTNSEDPIYTSTGISFALYDACPTECAITALYCATGAGGTSVLPPLSDNTDYWLNVWNDGGIGLEGTFGILLEYPPDYDASIDSITYPYNPVCGTLLNPTVILTNNGLVTLTSVNIQYDIDGLGTQNFAWTGSLPYTGTESVDLPSIISPGGLGHAFNAITTGPLNVSFPDEIPANNGHTNSYDVSGEPVVVKIRTDANSSQTYWRIYENGLGNLVAEGGTTVSPGPGVIWDPGVYAPNALHTASLCLPTTFGACYSLYVYDSGNNGITNGTWQLETPNGEVLLRDNGVYTDQSPSTVPVSPGYTNGHEFCLPKGPADIKLEECGIYTNLQVDKVYCKAVPGALKYQFRFSDPNAGYIRNIAVTTNWVRFNQMVTNPLVPGTIYFAAARADQGSLNDFSDDEFGGGCDMALDANVSYCTQLNPNPGPTFSCGATKSFGGSSKIWALPVATASQYHFRFVNIGEGYQKTVTRTNYVCPLNWVTTPLVNGSTYTVTVEAYVGGTWRGYCGAPCSLTILNGPAAGPNQNVDVVSDGNGMQMWPNPVRDGNVNLLIEGLTDDMQNITVAVYDAAGKLMLSKEYGNSGDVFNTVLALGSNVAAGTYQVNVTVNGKTSTQRLSVQ